MSESFNIDNFPTSQSALKMLSYVTDGFYDRSYVGKWLYQVMGLEHDSILEILETLPDQMFPETATWALMYHEKRDYRAPMTPYRMEVLLSDLSGCKVSISDIHDPGDDIYEPAHPNVFRVSLETGNNPVNLDDVLQKLNWIKQSHTAFTFRVTTMVGLCIGTATESYRMQHRLCGSYPILSISWQISRGGIDIDTSGDKTKVEYPMTGNSGETGMYPRTSTGFGITDGLLEVRPDGQARRVIYPMAGNSGEAGTYPGTSTGYRGYANSIVPEVATESYKVSYPLCGCSFDL